MRYYRIVSWILLAIALGIGGYFLLRYYRPPKGLAAEANEVFDLSQEPLQRDTSNVALPVISHGKTSLFLWAQASYSITGVVVSKKHYVRGFMKELSPYDLAIAWGDVDSYLPHMKFQQMVRFCLFKAKSGASVDMSYVNKHISNNHIIPANDNIHRALRKIKKKDVVKIDGFLVNVEGIENRRSVASWKTSLSRTDTGNGACEIIYVNRLRIGDKVYL